MRILGVCGSLRSGSFNAAAPASAGELCGAVSWEFTVEPELARLPFFDPDVVETDRVPDVVGR